MQKTVSLLFVVPCQRPLSGRKTKKWSFNFGCNILSLILPLLLLLLLLVMIMLIHVDGCDVVAAVVVVL